MRNVLVVGGAGYIGSHIAKALALQRATPVVVDNLNSGRKAFVKWGPLLEVDIQDRERLKAALARVEFDAVVHLAAHIEVSESVQNPEKYFRNNVGGTESLLSALEDLERRVPFVFSSTAAVYGQPDLNLIPETAPLKPINPYGESKKMAEERIRSWSERTRSPAALLRYFNVAGADPEGEIGEAHDPETHLIPRLLLSLLHPTQEFKIFGEDYPTPDGTCIRDYVHVWDLAQAHLAALRYLKSHPGVHVFNIGYSRGFSVREIIQTAEKVCARKVIYAKGERRAGDPAVLVADGSRAIKEMGWTPKFSGRLDLVLAHAWAWHKGTSP